MPGTCTVLRYYIQRPREGQPHIAGVLLEHGADTDARDDGNCTPLHRASQLGHLQVIHVLIEHGTDANARDHSNWTPLHGASQEGHLNVVHFLLSHGADMHASDHGLWSYESMMLVFTVLKHSRVTFTYIF
jgi:ankyrin repeat protein